MVLPLDITAPITELHGAAVAADNAFDGAGVDYLVHNAGPPTESSFRQQELCFLVKPPGAWSMLRLQRKGALIALPVPRAHFHCRLADSFPAVTLCIQTWRHV